MLTYRSIIGAVALYATTAFPSLADDFALILTNRDYDRVTDSPESASYEDYAQALQREGFRVYGGENWIARSLSQSAQAFTEALSSAPVDRVVIVLSGRMAAGPTDSWLLARDYSQITAMNVGQYALSVNTLADLLADYPGKSLIVVSPGLRETTPVGAGLEPGMVRLSLPDGVAAMYGPAARALPVLRDSVLRAGVPLGQLAMQQGLGVSLSGALPDRQPFGGRDHPRPDAETEFWNAVRTIDTIEAYRSYMDRYPSGRYHNEARRLIEDILRRPAREAEAIENALNLSRDARREIQRQLTLLGYDTRGIDGVFGRGTRTAIANYQRSKGWVDTGYVNSGQLDTLRQDARRRSRELEEEERRRRLEEERQDRDFWQSTGLRGDENGLRRYLRRFPDGIFADDARAQLDELDLRRRREADQQMRAAWDQARTADTPEAYRAFLNQYPGSDFAPTARDRIEELTAENGNRNQIERDKAEESVVAGNQVTRIMVEKTLALAGFDPGPTDGAFDKQSRRAIRQFQRANGLPVTGFVSQATMVRLLSRTGH